MVKILKEFKEFAVKGNALDLAIGVIIGGAFGKIVTSLVNDLIMPILSILIGGINFSDLKFIITEAQGDIAEVAFQYGAFLQAVFDFLIIAFSIFVFIKFLNSLKNEEPALEPEQDPEPTPEELLLTEIRNLLKNK